MSKSVSAGKKVQFVLTVEPGSQVYVTGTFNNWDLTANPMKDNPGSGHCKTTIPIQPGRHEYKFIVNGEWRTDLNCAEMVPNDQGTQNSVINV